jgi:hypothetical protein
VFKRIVGVAFAVAFSASVARAQELPKPAPAAEPPKAEAPKPASSGLELSIGDWKIKFYGFLRLDAHYDDSHPNNTQLITAIKAEDDEAPAAIREEENSEDFTMHARNSRFGVDVAGPAIAKLGDAKAMGKIEFDFLANGGTEAAVISRGVIRMRQAYLKLAWEEISVLAGQTWDIAGPLIPTANGEFLMWGAGNLGDRRPMAMADWRPGVLEGFTPILQAGIGLAGAIDGENLDGGTVRDGEASGKPCFQARAGLKGNHLWLEKKTFEAGGWAYFARERLDTLPAGWTEDEFEAVAYGVDVTLPLLPFLEIRGEAWWGMNINDVRGGILQGIQRGDGEEGEVESRGYWGEVVVKPLDWYFFCVGTSRDNPINSDLTRTVALPTIGAEDNRTFYFCNRFNAGAGVTFGADYTYWVTKWRGGDFEGDDNRFSFFAQYTF